MWHLFSRRCHYPLSEFDVCCKRCIVLQVLGMSTIGLQNLALLLRLPFKALAAERRVPRNPSQHLADMVWGFGTCAARHQAILEVLSADPWQVSAAFAQHLSQSFRKLQIMSSSDKEPRSCFITLHAALRNVFINHAHVRQKSFQDQPEEADAVLVPTHFTPQEASNTAQDGFKGSQFAKCCILFHASRFGLMNVRQMRSSRLVGYVSLRQVIHDSRERATG